MSMGINTFDYFEKLKAAGVSEEQAKAQVDAFTMFALNLEESHRNHLATKGDLSDLKYLLGSSIADFKVETANNFAALRKDMDGGFVSVRKDMDAGFATVRKEMDDNFAELRKEIDAKFATKKDMDAGFASVRTDMNDGFSAIRKEMADLKFDNNKAINNCVKWVFGIMIAQTALIIAIFRFFVK